MPNELILICSVVFIYGAALLGYKFLEKQDFIVYL